MKIIKPTKYDDNWYLHFTDGCFMHVQNDWKQLFGKWNWYAFHFIQIYMENDVMTGGFEFEMIVLGLGFRFRYNYNDKLTKMAEDIDQQTPDNL